MTDIQGWDEFSAYSWLNSPQGKKLNGIPLDRHVTIQEVRKYIEGPVSFSPAPQQEKRGDAIEFSPIRDALAELISEPWVDEGFAEAEAAAELTGQDITTEQIIRAGTMMYAVGIRNMVDEGDFENDDMLEYAKGLAAYAVTLYAYWKDQLGG